MPTSISVLTILLFIQSKEMPRKLRKTLKTRSRKNRRRTLRRIPKGGSGEQSLSIPSSAFSAKIGAPVNSADPWYN
jgi:hypothetical protein